MKKLTLRGLKSSRTGRWLGQAVLLTMLAAAIPVPGAVPLHVDVTAPPYGAIPNDGLDDSAAFQAALNALKTAGGGYLYVPDGGYMFANLVSVSLSTWNLTIQGQSTGVLLRSVNSGGVFKFIHSARTAEITIRDLSFVAQNAAGGSGTAVDIGIPKGGDQAKRTLTADNIIIRSEVGTSSYFNQGIVATNIFRPLFINCQFSAPTSTTDMSNTSINFKPTCGFDVSRSYGPVFDNCSVIGAATAYLMDHNYPSGSDLSLAGPEDGAFRFCTANYCRTGISFTITHPSDPLTREPTLWVRKCTITARDTGVFVKGRRILQINDNTFNQLSTSYGVKDVQLNNVHMGIARNNTFSAGASSGRKNIVVDSNGQDLILGPNFQWSGPTNSVISVDPGATDVLVY